MTRKRLYLDTMQDVLTSSSKVTVDVSKGNNLLYLPLDQMLQGARPPLRRSRVVSWIAETALFPIQRRAPSTIAAIRAAAGSHANVLE